MREWILKIRIADTWIADGYEATPERIHDAIMKQIGYCYSHEVEVEEVSAPPKETIKTLQGAAFPHQILVEWSDCNQLYIAEIPALEIFADGNTPEDALLNAKRQALDLK